MWALVPTRHRRTLADLPKRRGCLRVPTLAVRRSTPMLVFGGYGSGTDLERAEGEAEPWEQEAFFSSSD